nr:uncharacterized protein LOC116281454 isoform X2 [Vicugna pacos]
MPGPRSPTAPPGESCDGVPAPQSTLRSLAQHRPRAPAARLRRILSKAWPPARKSLGRAASPQRLDLQLDLPNQQGEPVLHSPVVLTQGPKSKERNLLLFRDWLAIAKRRSSESHRVKQKLPVSHLGVVSCDPEEARDKDEDGDLAVSRGSAVLFIVASDPCVTEFPSSDAFFTCPRHPHSPVLSEGRPAGARWLRDPREQRSCIASRIGYLRSEGHPVCMP